MTRAPQGEKNSRRGFDEKAYLSSKLVKAGEDPYRQHAFNQLESDKLSSDRPIRDTRHYRYNVPLAPSCGCCLVWGVHCPPVLFCNVDKGWFVFLFASVSPLLHCILWLIWEGLKCTDILD